MSKIENIIVPPFLKRLDFWLLTHKPHVWRTRGHFVIFYGAIVAALFFLLGLVYPYSLYDFHKNNSSNVVPSFGFFSFLFVVGSFFGWWFSIQKFKYQRTSVKHFFIEIGIYTIGCFTLWSVLLAFYLGFEFKTNNLLEKNKIVDKEWYLNRNFSSFGYMPHVAPNKLSDLNTYFSDGEKLMGFQAKRAEVTERYRQNSDLKKYDFIDENHTSNLSFVNWESKTMGKKSVVLPPQYKTPSGYFEALIYDANVRKKALKEHNLVYKITIDNPNGVEDNYADLFDEIITGLDYNGITEMTENIPARAFHHVNYSEKSTNLLTNAIKNWKNKRQFLESLDNKEIGFYKEYFTDLYLYFKKENPKLNNVNGFQLAALKNYCAHNFQNNETDSVGFTEMRYNNNNDGASFATEDQAAFAGERLEKLLPNFDLETQKKYYSWLKDENIGDGISPNIDANILDNAFKTLNPNGLDSLMFYQYYFLNQKLESFYDDFITNAFADYAVKKYTPQDFDQIHNLLIVNGFPDETPQYKDKKTEKIALLFYSEEYRKAVGSLESHRERQRETRAFLWSPFSVLYCLLGAIVFYILTLATGIQIWVSFFISGLYWAFMIFLFSMFRSSGDVNLEFSTFLIHSILFAFLIVYLANVKLQWQRANLIVNTIIVSGVGSVLAAYFFWEKNIREWYYSNSSGIMMNYHDYMRIMSNVLIVSVLIYLAIAWLLKRHLTFPKKR